MSTTTRSEKAISLSAPGAEPSPNSHDSELSVFVVFTSVNWTLKALERARELAQPLGADISVIALQVVPFPLPIDRPPVSMDFVAKRFEERAGEFSERTKVSAFLCRDPLEALKSILNPYCPVVMGVRKKWWPTRDERLARKLRRAGYEIILVETE